MAYKPIPSWPFYRVCDDGTVWSSKKKLGVSWTNNGEWRVLKPTSAKGKYPCVNLSRNGKAKVFAIHRLVLEAFHGPCPPNCEARHLNGDKTNNAASNLAWGTRFENAEDKKRHGTISRGRRHGITCCGEKNGTAKLTANKVLTIRALINGKMRNKEIAAMFGVAQNTISQIRSGKSWSWLFQESTVC